MYSFIGLTPVVFELSSFSFRMSIDRHFRHEFQQPVVFCERERTNYFAFYHAESDWLHLGASGKFVVFMGLRRTKDLMDWRKREGGRGGR